jgi:hypothetical protein
MRNSNNRALIAHPSSFSLVFAFAFLVVIREGDLLLLFSCHPSPQAEDLLLPLPLLLPLFLTHPHPHSS